MRRSWRRTGGSTSSRTTTRSTSTSWRSRRTRCTRRSAPARWSAAATSFLHGAPEYQGGGTVEIVTPDDVHWAGLPDREEAGSPNVVGAVAMAVAAQTLMDAGMDSVERHEASLTAYALERLRSVPGVAIYGETRPVRRGDRVGVIAFNVGVDAPCAGRRHPRLRSGDRRAQRLLLRAVVCRAPARARRRRSRPLAARASSPAIDREGREWFASASAPTTRSRRSTPSSRWCGASRDTTTDGAVPPGGGDRRLPPDGGYEDTHAAAHCSTLFPSPACGERAGVRGQGRARRTHHRVTRCSVDTCRSATHLGAPRTDSRPRLGDDVAGTGGIRLDLLSQRGDQHAQLLRLIDRVRPPDRLQNGRDA